MEGVWGSKIEPALLFVKEGSIFLPHTVSQRFCSERYFYSFNASHLKERSLYIVAPCIHFYYVLVVNFLFTCKNGKKNLFKTSPKLQKRYLCQHNPENGIIKLPISEI